MLQAYICPVPLTAVAAHSDDGCLHHYWCSLFCGCQVIAAGGSNGYSVTKSNQLCTYGDSMYSRLVLPANVKTASDKQQIQRVSATYTHTLALTTDGRVM
jgi:alpha-tubulin suppressor-like RCC1 family protein